jgi:PAS domain-containing protein
MVLLPVSEVSLSTISAVLYQQPTVGQSYEPYISALIVVCLAQTVLILWLLWQRNKRRSDASTVESSVDAEQALRESEARFRLVANDAPVLIWMTDTSKLRT